MNAEELTRALRADTASAEDLIRMEMNLGRAMRMRRVSPSTPRFAIVAGLALAAVAVFWLVDRDAPPPIAYEAPRIVLPIAPPALHIGSALAAAEGQLGNAHLVVTGDSLAHVDDDAITHAVVTLARGEIHVAFHPEHRGQEHLAIVTDVARVEVVGTEFVVTRMAGGATHVAVTEGIVRVITLATNEARDVTRGEQLDVMPSAVVVMPEPRARRSMPTFDQALTSADRGDLAGLERLADHGDRALRLDALNELSDRHHRTDPAAERADYDRILALDPSGEDGAAALFARGQLRERMHDPSAADDYAHYLVAFPSGSFAAQAMQHLCALDDTRCSQR